jgi:hypothetical protein
MIVPAVDSVRFAEPWPELRPSRATGRFTGGAEFRDDAWASTAWIVWLFWAVDGDEPPRLWLPGLAPPWTWAMPCAGLLVLAAATVAATVDAAAAAAAAAAAGAWTEGTGPELLAEPSLPGEPAMVAGRAGFRDDAGASDVADSVADVSAATAWVADWAAAWTIAGTTPETSPWPSVMPWTVLPTAVPATATSAATAPVAADSAPLA